MENDPYHDVGNQYNVGIDAKMDADACQSNECNGQWEDADQWTDGRKTQVQELVMDVCLVGQEGVSSTTEAPQYHSTDIQAGH